MSEEFDIPENLLYTEEHEWARLEADDTVVIGVTDYASKQLHEIVYVELPEAGGDAELMEVIGALESVKAVSDLNNPVGGTIIEVNDELLDRPELINESPYVEGWIAKLKPSDWEGDKVHLMDSTSYIRHVAESSH
ncbi:MAG: glycine cleavage system protein GcvH [Candidatus Bathyarchaeota archaeon]|jgi:glycine cleavage system H protein|nr:glycine cleavage system protein GcvH [Candidatus Bathyarchaeota archaeon]|tara:strand:- start:10 stop:417 length:408 start_codon:yes stop_codon:yes gene_type:complete